jgi:hypothetical protein
MHHNTFNADFYVTAATVIPVLFLALTLQGTFYREILGTWKHKAEHIPLGPTTPDVLEALCKLIIPLLLASLIILFGFAGEIGGLRS